MCSQHSTSSCSTLLPLLLDVHQCDETPPRRPARQVAEPEGLAVVLRHPHLPHHVCALGQCWGADALWGPAQLPAAAAGLFAGCDGCGLLECCSRQSPDCIDASFTGCIQLTAATARHGCYLMDAKCPTYRLPCRSNLCGRRDIILPSLP